LAKAGSPIKHDSTLFAMKQIDFDASYKTDSSFIDTSTNKLNILNPAFRSEHSFVHLIRVGYPIFSNSFVARNCLSDYFFPSNYFAPYISDGSKNTFYETKKQFTSLTYKHSGSTSDKEEVLEVFHTQNLNKAWNIGLNYNLYSSVSALNYQNSTDYDLNVFTRFTGKTFRNFNQIYFNSLTLEENGGIKYDSLVDYKISNGYEGVTVNFNNPSIAKTKYRQLGFNSINELKLNSIFINSEDTTEFSKFDFGSLYYNLNLETKKRVYTENFTNLSDTIYYNNFYNNKLSSKDSIKLDRIRNSIMLCSPNLSKYLPNLRFSLTNELFFSTNSVPEDTIKYKYRNVDTIIYNQKAIPFYQNTYITTNVSQKFQNVLWDFDWRMYLLGYQSGDHSVSITAKMFADSARTIGLILKYTEEALTPSFYYNSYFSNHYIWFNSFSREKKQILSAVAAIKDPAISASADYISLADYMYFDNNAMPAQVSSPIYIMAYTLKSRFEFWKFGTENDVTYQVPNTDNYIHVPHLIFYNSTDFKHIFHFFTGGKLFSKIGFDSYYHTSYNQDAYMPATGAFYLQNKIKEGNNFQVDFHITMKIKSVSFYFKYSHANSGFYNDVRQFTATHYPMLPATFSYGINWLFYD
jgi:hypothetical protein